MKQKKDNMPEKLEWTPELVQKFWDGLTHTRLQELGFSRNAGRSLIVAIDHILPRGGRILDFGAGDGDLIKFLCERGLSAAAYEQSEQRNQILLDKLQDCESFLGIISNSTQEKYDLLIMAEVIEHILDADLQNTLKRVVGLLKTGGYLVVTTPNNEDLDLNMAYCPTSNLIFHRWQHVRSFTDTSLPRLLSEYGMEEIATHQLEFNDEVYLPGDPFWGDDTTVELPSFLNGIRNNRPVKQGSELNLLYLGRKIS